MGFVEGELVAGDGGHLSRPAVPLPLVGPAFAPVALVLEVGHDEGSAGVLLAGVEPYAG